MKKLLIIGVAICSLSVSATAQGFGNLKGKKTASAVDTTKKTGTQAVTPSTTAPAVTPSNNSNVAAPKPTKTVTQQLLVVLVKWCQKAYAMKRLVIVKQTVLKIRWNMNI
jgi:predicted small secreted protein